MTDHLNRLTKLARNSAMYVVAWATLSLFTASQLVLTYTAIGGPAYWRATLRGSAMQWFPWLLLTPFVLVLARAIPLRGARRTRNALLQFVAPVVVAVGIVALSYAIRSVSGSPITRPFRTEYLRNLHSIAIVYWLLVAGQQLATSLRQSRERESQVARLEAQLAGARFDVLQAQLHPHFLFNTMHGISSLIHEDPDAAEDMLTALSDLLRITLGRGAQREIPLRDELGFLEQYLEIHQMRLGDRLFVLLDIGPDTGDLLVPSFALQPLVEKAIRHAIAPRRAGGRLDVASVHTGVGERDDDLKKAAFFDAAKWPRITFVSRRVERDGKGFVAVGPLTIRDVTREVRVPFAIVVGKGIDPFGNTRFSAAGKLLLNRRDFGVIGPAFWNHAISDSVEIEFEMPGRRWDCTTLGWGPKTRISGGQTLFDSLGTRPLDAAIAGGWALYAAHRTDTTYNFSSFEYEKAAGRLAQRGKLRESMAALELGIRVARDRSKPDQRAALELLLAEEILRAGDRAKALEHTRAAADADSTLTGAQLLVAFIKP